MKTKANARYTISERKMIQSKVKRSLLSVTLRGASLRLVLFLLAPILSASESIKVDLSPVAAVEAGAQWRFRNDSLWRDSGVIYSNLQTGVYSIEFKSLSGWESPKPVPEIVVKNTPEMFVTHGVGTSYHPSPQWTFSVTSNHGEVVGDVWPASAIENWVTITASQNSRWDALIAKGQRVRRYPLTGRDFFLPSANANYGVHLMAVPHRGFHFEKWTGDLAGSRNPATVHLTTNRQVTAQFRPVPTEVAFATLVGDTRPDSGRVQVHVQFSYPTNVQLKRLRVAPKIPQGWSVEKVVGPVSTRLATPDILVTPIEGTTAIPPMLNPLPFNIILKVSALAEEPLLQRVEVGATFTAETLSSELLPSVDAEVWSIETNPEPPLELRLLKGDSNHRLSVEIVGKLGELVTLQYLDQSVQPDEFGWRFFQHLTLTEPVQRFPEVVFPQESRSRFIRAVRIR